MKKQKKITKRDNIKYPALDPNYNLKTRIELIDDLFDYSQDLSEKDKDYLNRFSEEFNNANFNHEGKRVHPKKTKKIKYKTRRGKKTVDKYKKDAEDRNNSRNRCLYTKNKAFGAIDYIQDMEDRGEENENLFVNFQDNIIDSMQLNQDLTIALIKLKHMTKGKMKKLLKKLGITDKDKESLIEMLEDLDKNRNKKS